MNRISTAILSGAAVVALAFAAPTVANADELNPKIAYALAAVPGGHAVGPMEAVWPSLGMELIVPGVNTRSITIESVGSCPTGDTCAFSNSSLGGARLSWSSCGGPYSTAALGSVGSIADARSSGSFQALNGSTVVAGTSAGSWTNVSGSVNQVRCISVS
jgi:hypothetical protein